MTALAEVTWSAPEKKSYDNFCARLELLLARLDRPNRRSRKVVLPTTFEVRGSSAAPRARPGR